MNKYVPIIMFSTKYEDDDIQVTLDPLDRLTAMELFPKIAAQKDVFEEIKKAGGEVKSLPPNKSMELYALACGVLDKHVLDVKGLRDSDGNAVSKHLLLSKIFFLPLILMIFGALMEGAHMGKAKSVN